MKQKSVVYVKIFSISAANVEVGQTESDRSTRYKEKRQIPVSEPEKNSKSEIKLQKLKVLTSPQTIAFDKSLQLHNVFRPVNHLPTLLVNLVS